MNVASVSSIHENGRVLVDGDIWSRRLSNELRLVRITLTHVGRCEVWRLSFWFKINTMIRPTPNTLDNTTREAPFLFFFPFFLQMRSFGVVSGALGIWGVKKYIWKTWKVWKAISGWEEGWKRGSNWDAKGKVEHFFCLFMKHWVFGLGPNPISHTQYSTIHI